MQVKKKSQHTESKISAFIKSQNLDNTALLLISLVEISFIGVFQLKFSLI